MEINFNFIQNKVSRISKTGGSVGYGDVYEGFQQVSYSSCERF